MLSTSMAIIEQEFVELTRGLDLAAYWTEDDKCGGFKSEKPRCAGGFSLDDHWLQEFLGVRETVRYYHDKPFRDVLHGEANAVLKEYVGRAYFDEDSWEHQPKRIENLFGSEFGYHDGGTPWLMPVTDDPKEFAQVLDWAERTDMAEWALPQSYRQEWERRRQAGQKVPALGTGGRGPATIFTSVLATETALFWVYDEPELMRRFRDVLAAKMVEFNRVLRAFSGHKEAGWWITDDNCALFNREMCREFCFSVLERVLGEFANGGWRSQHSDSNMAHLMEDQYALGIRSVNYGPDIDVALIREKMPAALMCGHLPPFLLRNGLPEAIRDRIVSDFRKVGAGGGLTVTTAGSVAGGTGVGRLRWFMQCVQQHCRYDKP